MKIQICFPACLLEGVICQVCVVSSYLLQCLLTFIVSLEVKKNDKSFDDGERIVVELKSFFFDTFLPLDSCDYYYYYYFLLLLAIKLYMLQWLHNQVVCFLRFSGPFLRGAVSPMFKLWDNHSHRRLILKYLIPRESVL